MIDQIRTLPIRLAPIEGEALDSWLDTLCHRLSTTWGDLIEAIGLSALDGTRDNSWLLRLTGDQADKMAAATAVPATQLHAMTLSYYDGSGLRLLPDAAMIDRAFPWGRSRFSRYCPYCLRESGAAGSFSGDSAGPSPARPTAACSSTNALTVGSVNVRRQRPQSKSRCQDIA